MAFTFFFRDAQTLELLIEQALPALCGQAYIRIWDAGCAHGPEAYTLAMMLRERMSDYVFRNVRIHATDVDPQFGPQIAAGVYAEQEVKRIPYPIRYRYFQVADEPGYVQVVPEIREGVVLQARFVVPDAAARGLQPCRVQERLAPFRRGPPRPSISHVPSRIASAGLLATEHTQILPEESDSLFEPVVGYAKVYRRRDGGENVRRAHRWIARLERSRAEGDSQSATRLAAASPADPRGCRNRSATDHKTHMELLSRETI